MTRPKSRCSGYTDNRILCSAEMGLWGGTARRYEREISIIKIYMQALAEMRL